jgi:hypothetical protein
LAAVMPRTRRGQPKTSPSAGKATKATAERV